MDLKRALGFPEPTDSKAFDKGRRRMQQHIALQLSAADLQIPRMTGGARTLDIADSLLANYREKARILLNERTPPDARIEAFLKEHFADLQLTEPLRLPNRSLVLDRHGMARELSLPLDGDSYKNELVNSFRVKNGVLNNPRHDRRTTAGTFHVAEGGLPIPGDKRAVPKGVFAKLFAVATKPSGELMKLPFLAEQPETAETFVSLYLRPLVCPEVQGVTPHKSMEIRFFAPGGLVSNLDFVESIFGNAGDPLVSANDAALDVEHWTGHTGCVILAPQMLTCKKKELGLPHWDEATERQQQDSMCWKDPDEIYNDGQPFKITCRSQEGVIITLIADNYYGYSKKEVKTQISYAANLFGNVEEEHAGGAVAYPRFNLGERFQAKSRKYNGRTFDDVARDYAEFIDVREQGYGVDKNFPNLIYIPENASASLRDQRIRWEKNGQEHDIALLPGNIYMAPSGYKLAMEKHPAAPSWRLVGEIAEGVFCHKPCTVSGGGKSEIGKSLLDYMHYGSLFVNELETDLDMVQQLLDYDYSTRWREDNPRKPDYLQEPSRPILGADRTLGSVVKLLTASEEYSEEYNAFLKSIPDYIYALLFIIKRFEEPGWEHEWRKHFSVDFINGLPGHELKFRGRLLVGTYLRVGFNAAHQWRTYKLRQDFMAARKVQREDDISVSVVTPTEQIKHLGETKSEVSSKFVENCEYRFFQRPDEAIHRGFDKQAESDLAGINNFISNFAPLTKQHVEQMVEYVADFDAFSPPMQNLLRSLLDGDHEYVVCSANPREIDGKPSKNPRYLQNRPDLVDPFSPYVAERGLRLFRSIPVDEATPVPVHAVLMGRRNNPPEPERGIPSLAVYNPIHYQELPELFMDLICSLTGKSPSTTGFGSEGALTKGPFNALRTSADLNSALVSYILTGTGAFSTSAGHVGPEVQVDHDISLLIPEIWCRLTAEEREPAFMIAEGFLEKLDDIQTDSGMVPASRLGYRITREFLRRYCGRVFDHPGKVFDEKLLKPELQDRQVFLDGIRYISDAHRRVAQRYFDDGTIEEMCPPLQALLTIMVHGEHEGRGVEHPEIRQMFTREHLLKSDWYGERLDTKWQKDNALWQRHVASLKQFLANPSYAELAQELGIQERLDYAREQVELTRGQAYRDGLVGFLGCDPMRVS